MTSKPSKKFIVAAAFASLISCNAFKTHLHQTSQQITIDSRFLSCPKNPGLFMAAPKGARRLDRNIFQDGGIGFVPGLETLTLASKLTGVSYALGALIKGVACSFSPSRSMNLMGLKKSAAMMKNVDNNDSENAPSAVEFLMIWGGAFQMSLGLTALLALRAEIELLGHVPSQTSMFRCIYMGILPMLGMLYKLIGLKRWPDTLYLNDKKRVTFGLILGTVVSTLTLAGKMEPHVPTTALSAVFAVFGVNTLRDPSTIFRRNSVGTEADNSAYDLGAKEKLSQLTDDATILVTNTIGPEESLIGRKFGVATMSYAVLVHMLRNPVVNVLPAIGFTALTHALGNIYIALGTDDIKNCNLSNDGILASAAASLAASAICLRHFLLK